MRNVINNAIRNPKTTVLGLFAIASAVVTYFLPEYLPQLEKVAAILAGCGLIAAKDGDRR